MARRQGVRIGQCRARMGSLTCVRNDRSLGSQRPTHLEIRRRLQWRTPGAAMWAVLGRPLVHHGIGVKALAEMPIMAIAANRLGLGLTVNAMTGLAPQHTTHFVGGIAVRLVTFAKRTKSSSAHFGALFYPFSLGAEMHAIHTSFDNGGATEGHFSPFATLKRLITRC